MSGTVMSTYVPFHVAIDLLDQNSSATGCVSWRVVATSLTNYIFAVTNGDSTMKTQTLEIQHEKSVDRFFTCKRCNR